MNGLVTLILTQTETGITYRWLAKESEGMDHRRTQEVAEVGKVHLGPLQTHAIQECSTRQKTCTQLDNLTTTHLEEDPMALPMEEAEMGDPPVEDYLDLLDGADQAE